MSNSVERTWIVLNLNRIADKIPDKETAIKKAAMAAEESLGQTFGVFELITAYKIDRPKAEKLTIRHSYPTDIIEGVIIE